MYELSFGMYLLQTWSARELCNWVGRTPICRDSRVNNIFRDRFPISDY